MKRILLDTCVVVEMLLDATDFDKDVAAILEDPDNQLCASFETMRELVVFITIRKFVQRDGKKPRM